MEPDERDLPQKSWSPLGLLLMDKTESPFDSAADEEVRARVEGELRKVSEPYRTTVVLRDIEGMSYEEIAEITQVSVGTVKSRLTRGRNALRQRLIPYVREAGRQLGLEAPHEEHAVAARTPRVSPAGRIEVTP